MNIITFPPHACSLTLIHNDHLNNYQSAAQMIEDDPQYYSDDSFVSPEDRQRCINTNEIWTMHWYPNTPVGFCLIHASSLDVLNSHFNKPSEA